MVERAMENLAKEGEQDDFKNAAITFIYSMYIITASFSVYLNL